MACSHTHADARDRGYGAPANEEEEEYDVVICGTDLIQSILSSALSRAGKKVLHCDGNEWYGGFDAVLTGGSTLDSFIGGCGASTLEGKDCKMDDGRGGEKHIDSLRLRLSPREKLGNVKLHSQTFMIKPNESDKIEEDTDNGPSESDLESLPVNGDDKEEKEEMTHAAGIDISPMNETTTNFPVQSLEHGFCFDLTPSLLYASGEAVECLVKSGVSDYVEFKSLKGLYLLTDEAKSSTTRGGKCSRITVDNKSIGSTGSDKLMSYRVPCSKGDVFRSKLLSPVDKRRIMKFLQLVSDYGMAAGAATTFDGGTDIDDDNSAEGLLGEDAIQSVNERHLHRGRALSRPQNKATPSSSEMEALMRCVRENMSFSGFLTQVAKLPERLSTVVAYALALTPFVSSQYSTKDGLDDLVRHLAALGRFGDTAFLVPMYGSGELSQAFCRSGAVYGSTYMLRRSPMAIVLDEGAKHVKGVLLSGEERIGGMYDLDTNDVSEREFLCKHVVVPSTMLSSHNDSNARTFRRISILQGKLMLDEDQSKDGAGSEQRHAIIIPPGNPDFKNRSAIHGVAVDDTAFVAPAGKNYTVLHLTTSRQEGDSFPDDMFVNALSRALTILAANRFANDGVPCLELHHISFSYATDGSNSTDDVATKSAHYGFHICHRDAHSLTCDSSFREAERIFREICPDCDFLGLSKKVKDSMVHLYEEDGDDEKAVLESAYTMIHQVGSLKDRDRDEDSAY